jgi:hypothetical protein
MCHQVTISFNMVMTLRCTRHITTYFRLLVPWFKRPARHSAFFLLLRLTIASTKSLALAASCLDPDWWQIVATLLVSFKYMVFFDAGLKWGTQARYVQKRCLQRLIFFEIYSWRLVGCTHSLHDYVALWDPCWYMARFGQDSYATIGKGSVSRDKDSSGTHVFDPKQ